MSDLQKYNPEELMNKLISHEFPEVLEKYPAEDLENNLAVYINELIDKDFKYFNKLVNLLYRIDISEQKLKIALQNEDKTISSSKTIAKLIIERQLQKLEFRKKFSKKKIE
jgi:hypothetical protein